eukprot:414049_1
MVEIRTRILVLIFNIFVNVLILTPIFARCYVIFNRLSKHSQLLIIQKRYPNIIKLSCYFCFFILLFERSVVIFVNANLEEIVGKTTIMLTARLSRFTYVMVSVVIMCGLWRFWLIFYELKIAHTLSHNEWKKHLNSTIAKNNWFINNRRTYGSQKYIQKIMIISWVIFSIIRIIMFQLFMFHQTLNSLCRSIDAVLYLLPIVLVLIIGCKAPSIQDKFYLRQEITRYCLIVIISILIYIVSIILNRLNVVEEYWIKFVMCNIVSLSAFALVMTQTWWITYKIRMDPIYQDAQQHPLYHIEMNDIPKNQITMRSYLSEQQGFESFVQHLQKEFSLEIILFLIETNQFKTLLKMKQSTLRLTRIDEHEENEYKNDVYQGIFTHQIDVPKSQIVYQIFEDEQPNLQPSTSLRNKISSVDSLPEFTMSLSNNHTTIDLDEISKLKTVCFLLYDRYISVGSELEINISFDVRNNLAKLLDDATEFIQNDHEMNKRKLFYLFDDAIKEQMRLMMSSFSRFKKELNQN